MEDGIIIAGYHLIVGGGGLLLILLGIYGHIYRYKIKPIEDWRKATDDKYNELSKEHDIFKVQVELSLAEGTKNFADLRSEIASMRDDIKEMTGCVIRMETALKHSISKGVGMNPNQDGG